MLDLTTDWSIKVCGITSLDDAEMVCDAGATSLGLIVAESPRHVTGTLARRIADEVRGRIATTLVVRGLSDVEVLRYVDEVEPDAVQLHDPLGAGLLDALRTRRVSVIRALATSRGEVDEFDDAPVDAVLVDGPEPGSGREHDWDETRSRWFSVPLIAAGGLRPENVESVIGLVRPWGVDVASGVEQGVGRKDPTLVAAFVSAARRAFEDRRVQ